MYTGKEAAFLRHCRAPREGAEITVAPDIPASIVKAFVMAISPFPRAGLPSLEFDFHMEELEQGLNSEDVLGIMTSDKVDVKDLVWDVEACFHMHKLCVAFDCTVVQDMVIDKLREIFLQHCAENKPSEFVLQVKYMNELEDEDKDEEPFLHVLIDIMLDQNEHGINFPEHLAEDLVDMVGERSNEKTELDIASRPLHNRSQHATCKN